MKCSTLLSPSVSSSGRSASQLNPGHESELDCVNSPVYPRDADVVPSGRQQVFRQLQPEIPSGEGNLD
jgi:hypothetical protein